MKNYEFIDVWIIYVYSECEHVKNHCKIVKAYKYTCFYLYFNPILFHGRNHLEHFHFWILHSFPACLAKPPAQRSPKDVVGWRSEVGIHPAVDGTMSKLTAPWQAETACFAVKSMLTSQGQDLVMLFDLYPCLNIFKQDTLKL